MHTKWSPPAVFLANNDNVNDNDNDDYDDGVMDGGLTETINQKKKKYINELQWHAAQWLLRNV